MSIWQYLKAFFKRPAVLGFIAIVVALAEWEEHLEALSKVPGHISEAFSWFARYPSVIRIIAIGIGVLLILIDQQKRNDRKYLTDEKAKAIFGEVHARDIDAIRESLTRDIHQSFDEYRRKAAFMEGKVDALHGLYDGLRGLIKDLTSTALINQNVHEFDKLTNNYIHSFRQLQGFVEDKKQNWTDAVNQEKLLIMINLEESEFSRAQAQAKAAFAIDLAKFGSFDWMPAPPADIGHIPMESLRMKYQDRLSAFRNREKKIQLVRQELTRIINEANDRIAEFARKENKIGTQS